MSVVETYTSALFKIHKTADKDYTKLKPQIGEALASVTGLNFLRYLAKGGQGALILLRDKENARNVVGKFLFPHINIRRANNAWDYYNANKEDSLTNPQHRFERGAMIQKQLAKLAKIDGHLQYGYIPEIYKVNRGKHLYTLQEYIEAPTLLEWIDNRRLEEKIYFLVNILRLVDHTIHGNGVIYGDFKPQNILVLKSGLPCLVDFDVAKKARDDEEGLKYTVPQDRLYSPLYSSPQQRADCSKRGYQDDIFSLGLVFWITLVGHDIVTKNIISMDSVDLFDDLCRPAEIVDPTLRRIFLNAAQPQPENRYKDVSFFLEDLERYYSQYFMARGSGEIALISLLEVLGRSLTEI